MSEEDGGISLRGVKASGRPHRERGPSKPAKSVSHFDEYGYGKSKQTVQESKVGEKEALDFDISDSDDSDDEDVFRPADMMPKKQGAAKEGRAEQRSRKGGKKRSPKRGVKPRAPLFDEDEEYEGKADQGGHSKAAQQIGEEKEDEGGRRRGRSKKKSSKAKKRKKRKPKPPSSPPPESD